jgi:hypothetical protein
VEHLAGHHSVTQTAAGASGGPVSPRPGTVALVLGWAVTIVSLVVLDDLVFGPVFWALARWQGSAVAAAVAFVVYFVTQLFIVHQGTRPEPHRLAAFFLRRLGLQRGSVAGRPQEEEIRSRVLGAGSAILLSPVIGGVVPPMILWHRGQPARFVRRLSVVTAAVYASEFALLHGWIPGAVGR